MKTCLIVLLTLVAINAKSHPGVGIVMDSKGNVFFTDLKHVWKINTDGRLSIAVRNVHTHELYIDKSDNLFGEHLWYEEEAMDKWGHYIWKLSARGVFEKVVPPRKGFNEHFSFVRDDSRMFMADKEKNCDHLMVIDEQKRSTQLTDECFTDIRWMTASDGNVYLIDRFDLKKVDVNGDIDVLATNLNEKKLTQFMVNDPHLLMGVWTDHFRNVYVAIYGGRMVKKISQEKKVSVVAETSIGWSPTGGLVAANGDYWLLECSSTNAVRVEQITTGGKRFIYSTTE